MTSIDEALRALRLRRWMMLAGLVIGAFLAAINARDAMDKARPDWLDIGLVVVWGFVALSAAAGYVMLTRQIGRLERHRQTGDPDA